MSAAAGRGGRRGPGGSAGGGATRVGGDAEPRALGARRRPARPFAASSSRASPPRAPPATPALLLLLLPPPPQRLRGGGRDARAAGAGVKGGGGWCVCGVGGRTPTPQCWHRGRGGGSGGAGLLEAAACGACRPERRRDAAVAAAPDRALAPASRPPTLPMPVPGVLATPGFPPRVHPRESGREMAPRLRLFQRAPPPPQSGGPSGARGGGLGPSGLPRLWEERSAPAGAERRPLPPNSLLLLPRRLREPLTPSAPTCSLRVVAARGAGPFCPGCSGPGKLKLCQCHSAPFFLLLRALPNRSWGCGAPPAVPPGYTLGARGSCDTPLSVKGLGRA